MKITFLILAVTGLCPLANAATVSFFQDFGPASIGSPLFSVTLPKFNPALGTLTKVTLTLNGQTSGSTLLFDNEAASPGTVSLQVGTTITATSSFLSALVATPAQTASGSVTADELMDGSGDFTGPDSLSLIGGSGTDTDFNSSTAPGVLSAVTGPGTISVDLSNSIFTSSSTSGIFGPVSPTAGTFSGNVTVEYEYNLVPEPSSALLGGLGLLALMRRRR